ncbi:protein with CHU family gliding motility-associated C-terminal domain [Psychroflexus torquis ATCC 700755]|uniref:Protein with CHU family gliding motility-associated C-terminal domain n=1 Tax=Psychroflexus torquis (strain ATCC 700755 / CIP 106069 / ACAM 623) TaxID=313595 RepID=K4IA94_PSYTT|nr:gliding motility-associated C-terminal domain-containing protein [Psychroflexus torquis]AFU67349.1 protein with CHU family gliding motility-associated C-terminal domain [Psychroflexus torquis ATCC 700755]
MKTVIKLCLLLLICSEFTFGKTPPETTNDSYTTRIDRTLEVDAAIGLMQNDADSLALISFKINNVDYSAGQTATIPEGSINSNTDGSLSYNPTPRFKGNVPVSVYAIADETSSATGNLFLSIAPIARNDYATANINTPLTVPASGVLGNDTSENENPLTVISFTINGTVYTVGNTVNLDEGDFTLFADGSYTFEPFLNYSGGVPPITYTISDGTDEASADLFLIVEDVGDLIEFLSFSSCNQGFSTDGNYKILYSFRFTNKSIARDSNPLSLIRDIEIFKDFDEIYGSGCVTSVDDVTITTTNPENFREPPYPLVFSNTITVNPNFLDVTSGALFDTESINDAILYPRQITTISYCISVNPFCGGRPDPTPSPSGIDFEAVLDLTSSAGSDDTSLNLTDFHTTEAIIIAELDIPVISPEVNPDGTYNFTNTVTITNEGTGTASNVNFNMGLGSFLDNRLTFNELNITQVSVTPVNVNSNYDGDLNTTLLESGTTLESGESIVLEIFHLTAPVNNSIDNNFNQITPSQTQGPLDGFDEGTSVNRRLFSFVTWEDGLGEHLDRYYDPYIISVPEIDNQCRCDSLGMSFLFTSSASSEKVITETNTAPNGILEHEEFTFQLSFTNTSPLVDLVDLQLEENLADICGKPPVSFTTPVIVESESNATINPGSNMSFNGDGDINIFDGTSGLLQAGETITIEITVVLNEDCIGENIIKFSGTNPLGDVESTESEVDVNASTDTDNDGISNAVDIDDDNDTILDVEESNGADPLDDADGNSIPNYRDIGLGLDANNDGIVDSFDFDGDGVPNHFDLDSDNDGIFDINEVGNSATDTDDDGQTDNSVGLNGLDDTVEIDDSPTTPVTYQIANTDMDANPNYLDIDSDADGIVDNIEAQPTDTYIPPSTTFTENGVNTAYTNGLSPINTDGDLAFDYIDINSDNDIREDFIEGWDFTNDGFPETEPLGRDADNDGLDDGYDTDNSRVNPTNGQRPTDFPNVDYSTTPERDWREIMAIVVLLDDVNVVEGNDLQFTFSLVRFNDNTIPVQSATPVEIDLFTTDGTGTTTIYDVAISPFDYNAVVDNQFVIPVFTETFPFEIASNEDDISEFDELFTLTATITSGNTINTEAIGIGTILDNDLLPNITMNDVIEIEGEDLVYTIILSNPSSRPTDIDIVSEDNTALSPEDYIAITDTLNIIGTIDPGNPNDRISFNITTLLDNLNEPEEEYLNVFGNVISNNVGNEDLTKTGTILDIDPDPFMVITNPTVVEGSPLVFIVTLINETTGASMGNFLPINFNLKTEDITTTINSDYPSFFASTSIPALETSFTQDIPTIDDSLNEKTETMNLTAEITSGQISNSSSGIRGLGTLKDNDFPNLFSPNNDGRSDVFKIDGLEDFPNFKLDIFDRWGSELYNYSNNGSLSPIWWDGTNNGKRIVEGVYFYSLDYNDGVTKPKTGFIQLIR